MNPPTFSTAPLVEMRGITKRFPGVIANQDVSLAVYAGEIHALLGENGAGKSTLMYTLAGLYRPDEGQLFWRGRPAEIGSPRAAFDLGIGMVHQHFTLVAPMTVAENVILGLDDAAFVLDMEAVGARIRVLGQQYGLRVEPETPIWQLSVGEQQRVEILKLLYRGADLLILDEPTAVLTPQESEELGETLRRMAAEGKAIIFITHKLDEVMRFADRVTVLRGGRVTATHDTASTTKLALAREMVGHDLLFRLGKPPSTPGEVVLSIREAHARNDKGLPALRGLSLDVRAGEIVGIAGVAGNGQQELAEAITGLRPITRGHLYVNGREMINHSPLDAIRAGISYVPADRMAVGAAGNMTVADNLIMKGFRQPPLSRGQFLSFASIAGYARRLIEAFRIATPDADTPIRTLSGGNLQKAILAREIDAPHSLLVAVHPTRGLDVGASETVQRHLLTQRGAGAAVLLISEDLDELLALSDRVAVLYEGRIMGVMPAEGADVESIGLMMAGEAATEGTVDGGR